MQNEKPAFVTGYGQSDTRALEIKCRETGQLKPNPHESAGQPYAIVTGAERYRHEKGVTALMALEALDAQDAATIAAAVLDEIGAGYPVHTAFGDIRADADFWADCANVAELEAYFAASLKRLGHRALGINSRKRLMVRIWDSLGTADRAAFIAFTAKEAAA